MALRSCLLLATAILAATPALADNPAPLRVYVPRAIVVNAADLRLDALCVVRCQDEDLARSASAVALGRSPQSGEKIVIDRRTILSRLAASGIAAARVEFSGADQVVASRGERTVEAQRLLQAAEDFLRTDHPGPQGALYLPQDDLKPLQVAGTDGNLEFRPRLAKDAAQGTLKVEVVVAADGKELGAREVTFRLACGRKELVATRDIPAGGVVTAENAKVRVTPTDKPSPQEPAVALGATLAVAVRQGAVLQASMVRQAGAGAGAGAGALAVRRNQSVVMKIQTAQFTVSSVGLALQDGKAGDVIKVQNADTRKIVSARIAPDGTVSPLYEEKPS